MPLGGLQRPIATGASCHPRIVRPQARTLVSASSFSVGFLLGLGQAALPRITRAMDVPELLRYLPLIVVGWFVLSLPLGLVLGRLITASRAAPTPRASRTEGAESRAA